MCATCGCSDTGGAVLIGERGEIIANGHAHSHADGNHTHDHDHADHGQGHEHEHEHEAHDHAGHHHDHSQAPHDHRHDRAADNHAHHHGDGNFEHVHPAQASTLVTLERAVLAKNDALAGRNRAWFAGCGIVALNLVSSPGSGKTTLLERTIRELGAELPMVVIEGDQATENDSVRIRAAGARALQVNTGTGCHLEADMIERALQELAPAANSIVMIENVGNLVCPALFDLGEHAKVAILSVTEGDDKPAKYPHMFAAADLFIINKIDLLPYVDFDVERCIAHARAVRPGIPAIALSARTGENMGAWYDWIRESRALSAV
jgi:hydrogenase nickel incorporation protein HypB